jgi:hypothetical protein
MATLPLADESRLNPVNENLDATLDSVAVARLIEEVRSTDFEVTRAYNRTYNRHNR